MSHALIALFVCSAVPIGFGLVCRFCSEDNLWSTLLALLTTISTGIFICVGALNLYLAISTLELPTCS